MIAHAATRKTITWLQINWKNVNRIAGATDSKSARMAHASQILKRPISTFNDLSQAEADRLVLSYKQELGEEFKPAGAGYQGARRWSRPRPLSMEVDGLILVRIGEMAAELWEGDWGAMLERRVCERFGVADAKSLTPSQARSMVEELLQRIFIRDCRASGYAGEISRKMIEAGKEYLRAKFFTGSTGTLAGGTADTARSGCVTETQRRGAE